MQSRLRRALVVLSGALTPNVKAPRAQDELSVSSNDGYGNEPAVAGFWMFLGYLVAAVLCVLFIVTVPLAIAALRIGLFALWPFGRTVVKRPAAGAGSTIGNLIWFVIAGWWLTLGHIVTGILLCLTIIGIPLGLANLKLVRVSLTPFGRDIAPADSIACADAIVFSTGR